VGINQIRKNINVLWEYYFHLHEEFSKYIKVEGATSEDVFDYLFDLGVGKFLSEKEKKNIYIY